MNSLKHKMTSYEVIPPADVWDKITASLDESEIGKKFPTKLHDMQMNPPAAAWINIEAELSGAEAPVVPIRKSISPFVKYAAAAVLIGILTISYFQYFRLTKASTQSNTTDIASVKPDATPALPSVPDERDRVVTTSPNETTPENKEVIARVDQPARNMQNRSINRRPVAASYPFADVSDYAGDPLYAYAEYSVPDMADRYIMLLTPEGNIIRMSKKLGNLVCCVSGEEQDAECKSQLKKWQEKLATSPAAPGNFLDIVNMVNSLDDNGTEL
jgi:hypothetical protein